MGERQVSPVTPIDRRLLQQPETEHRPREIPQFRPPQQQSQEVTLGQRIDNAVQAVKDFFSFSDALKGEVRTGRERQ